MTLSVAMSMCRGKVVDPWILYWKKCGRKRSWYCFRIAYTDWVVPWKSSSRIADFSRDLNLGPSEKASSIVLTALWERLSGHASVTTVFNFISYSVFFSNRLHKAHGTSVRFMLKQLKTDTHLALRKHSNCTRFSTHLFLWQFHTPIPTVTHTCRTYNSHKIIFNSSFYSRIHCRSTINSSSSSSSSSNNNNNNNNNNSIKFFFIYVLTEQPNGQLQRQSKYKETMTNKGEKTAKLGSREKEKNNEL
jgi:hypothetical protein